MNRHLIGRFYVCSCGAKTALVHLIAMRPPACAMCGWNLTAEELLSAKQKEVAHDHQ